MEDEMMDRDLRAEQLAAWALDRAIEAKKVGGDKGTIVEDAKAFVDFVLTYKAPKEVLQ